MEAKQEFKSIFLILKSLHFNDKTLMREKQDICCSTDSLHLVYPC